MGEENSAWQGVTRDFANILHGEQEFSFHGPPPVAGTELIGLQSIDRTYEKVGARGGAMTLPRWSPGSQIHHQNGRW